MCPVPIFLSLSCLLSVSHSFSLLLYSELPSLCISLYSEFHLLCLLRMLTFTIKVLAVLAILGGSGAMAAENQQIKARSLVERQSDQSFVPTTITGTGTCADRGEPVCAELADNTQLCYNPDQGDKCCSSKCQYKDSTFPHSLPLNSYVCRSCVVMLY